MSDRTARSTTCTIARPSGEFCDAPAFDGLPFPICGRHAAELYRAVRDRMDERVASPLGAASLLFEDAAKEQYAKATYKPNEIIYYVRVGDHVKIGYTSNLKRRLSQYGPTARLLASEAGTLTMESRRLREFAEYLAAGNEWFYPGPRLMAHIDSLRSEAAA